MSTPIGPPNYQQLKRILTGVESTRGTLATMTNKWYGRLAINRRQPLAESEEFAGTFFSDYTPTRGAVMVDGTYYQKMSYEDAHLFRYAVKGGVTGTSDGESDPGYTYLFSHTPSRDDIDTFSAEYGDLTMIKESRGLFFPEFTLSSDIDDPQAVWKWNSRVVGIECDLKAGLDDVAATGGSTTTFVKTAWGQTIDALIGRWIHIKSATEAGIVGLWREILDNDATSIAFAALPATVTAADVIDVYPGYTAGISDRTREEIKGPGTSLYLADEGATLDSGDLQTGRFISFSVSSALNAGYKRFMDNVDEMSNRMDRGMIRVMGQVRLEFDRKREWDKYKAMTPEYLRIRQTGSTIDVDGATTKEAQIDVYRAVWDDPTEDVRGSNITITWPFRGYVSLSEGIPVEYLIKSEQSALLA